MRKKIKVILGEELYDIGPAFLTAAVTIAGIAIAIIRSIKIR